MSQEATIGLPHVPDHKSLLWPSTSMAKPLHVQRVEEALRLEPLLTYVETLNKSSVHSDQELSTDAEGDSDGPTLMDPIQYSKDMDGNRVYNGVVISRAERKADKCRLFNFSRVKKTRKWLKNVLLSDSSSDEDDDETPLTDADVKDMLKEHLWRRRHQRQFARDRELKQYQYYSVGLLSNYDKFYDHQKLVVGPAKRRLQDKEKLEKRILKAARMKRVKPITDEPLTELKEEELSEGEVVKPSSQIQNTPSSSKASKTKVKKLTAEQIATRRRRLWVMIMKKEIPRAQKQKAAARKEMLACIKKVAKECQKECRRSALVSQKTMKDAVTRARRLSKEMQAYWKRFEKVEKEHRRKAEKEALEQRKIDMELREMKRQQRKLNFLITQTELYAHFMARKLTGGSDADRDVILQRFDEPKTTKQLPVPGGLLVTPVEDDYNSEEMKVLALSNAEAAYKSHQYRKQTFDMELKREKNDIESAFANPSISTAAERPQPSIFEGKLKGYQLKGMNWLANLYDQGINGILADEMGLGKTVQSIAFLAHLAESQQIWGPFLIIAPASTLHNWQQETSRFVPQFKVVPYWGNTQDRRILRKFWSQEHMHMKEASFHIVITSYQLIVQDIKYFQRIKWHYMILDEAQAIKSSSSARWKLLLSFNCRNRLLLTGTPIQNSMGELWALLHFIMPTLFDSHDEFNEWFSKDIESHVEKQSGLDENQLSRLHMILKPFMLRRVKKDVENELSDKIEVLVYCPLTIRQKLLYQAVKNKISIEDLLQSSSATGTSQAGSAASSLMNLVMQFRKVCNHPDLFERREIRSPFYVQLPPYCLPKLIYREALLDSVVPSKRHLLFDRLCIFTSAYIHRTLFPQKAVEDNDNKCFSFTRFIDLSPGEVQAIMLAGLCARWLTLLRSLEKLYLIYHQRQFRVEPVSTRYLDRKSLLLDSEAAFCSPSLRSSQHMRGLVFCRHNSTVYAHCDVTLHCVPETPEHRHIRHRHASKRHDVAAVVTSPKRLPLSPSAALSSTSLSPTRQHQHHHHYHTVFPHTSRPAVVIPCLPTDMPSFLYYTVPKTYAGYCDYYCSDRSASWQHLSEKLCGTYNARSCLLYGSPGHKADPQRLFFPREPAGLAAVNPKHGFSCICVPDKESLVTDAGKLSVLDRLLTRLKAEDHRVLIYSQMTRMIDILEEYLWHRKHTYMRLDGSSKISDRRDMVADFQTRSDIFVFLLSTRAGGLGINLTAADTVIFYDSDWNPTVDQQAMDRAHRLGQTKQVTVYRLICKGTIEERIVQRAKEKSEIQRMVISGSSFSPDILKPKEVVSLLLDDDEMERKLQQRQEEKKQKEEHGKEKDRERKRKIVSDKPKSGRGPGRPPKKPKCEVVVTDENVTIPATLDDSTTVSVGSMSTPAASPRSEISVVSELTRQSASLATDDESLDGLVIVDDVQSNHSPSTLPPVSVTPVKRGTGRSRGRPRGSGVGLRSRGPGSIQRSLVAAEAAAATAAKTAAYAAYGYSFTGDRGASASRADSPNVPVCSVSGRSSNGTVLHSGASPTGQTGARR